MMRADVIVVGMGAMGSASAYQIARRGVRTIAIDRFDPPHDQGSTHGVSRLTRESIGEGDAYVPLARRSHEIWREIEAETGDTLLLACGTLVIGGDRSVSAHGKQDFVGRTIAAARRFGIPHETLSAAEVVARYPQFALRGDEEAYFEPGGGLVYPERCLAAQLAMAGQHGAQLRRDEQVRRVEVFASHVRVTTDRETYEAGDAVLAAGPWLPELLGGGGLPLALHRQVMFWYAPGDEAAMRPERLPAFVWFHGEGVDDYFYGFPALSDGLGVKVATESYGTPLARPEALARNVAPQEAEAMHASQVAGRLPGLTTTLRHARACLYTVTPDADFVIGRDPERPRLVVVSPCSGHGFKHSAAIGEAVAELVTRGRSTIDLAAFDPGRFVRAAQDAPAA